MLTAIRKSIVYAFNFIFDHRVSPLRHIPDVAIRHYILQALGLMWAVTFTILVGGYKFIALNVIGHTVLIAAAAITVATWTAAAKKPKLFVRGTLRRHDGEHE